MADCDSHGTSLQSLAHDRRLARAPRLWLRSDCIWQASRALLYRRPRGGLSRGLARRLRAPRTGGRGRIAGDTRMRLLVVGGGSIGKRHLTNFKKLGVEDLAVVDPREDRRQEVADRVGVTHAYPDLGDALNAAKFDGVVVGTPTVFHTDAAARCLAAGAHVL